MPRSPRVPGSLPTAKTQTAGSKVEDMPGTPLMHGHNEPANTADMRGYVVQ